MDAGAVAASGLGRVCGSGEDLHRGSPSSCSSFGGCVQRGLVVGALPRHPPAPEQPHHFLDRDSYWKMMNKYIGSDVTSLITLPIIIFEPLSMLQKMAEVCTLKLWFRGLNFCTFYLLCHTETMTGAECENAKIDLPSKIKAPRRVTRVTLTA